MARVQTKTDDIMPSATPTNDEIRHWRALPRDEQVTRMRKTLQKAVDSGISEKSMDDIKASALKRIAAGKNV